MSHPSPDCSNDPIACLKDLFVERVLRQRIAAGQNPAQRPVFLKPHGVAHGRFTVRPNLPEELRVGVFEGRSYPTWVRFSSDTHPSKPDLKTTCGVAIKLFDVPGEKILEPKAPTHDFLFQNYDIFFVDNAKEFCELTYAGVVGGSYDPFFKAHPKTERILGEMAQDERSVARMDYWSVLPFRFGFERHVKYKLEPISPAGDFKGLKSDAQDALYLDLKERLLEGEILFRFLLQFRKDNMPLDEATVRWSESEPLWVATLTLPRQDIDAAGQETYGENLAFNTWHALPVHAPVGSLAEARRVVYQASAQMRRNANHVPATEPSEPRPFCPAPPEQHGAIVRAAIHPSIGVARVGNSPGGYFFAPEVPEAPAEGDGYRDPSGALKRQAARFRIYGYDVTGAVVAELTAENASIDWCVHVANLKASWYQFGVAQDIPEAASVPPSARRNAGFTGAARAGLANDPGPRWIHGVCVEGSNYRFDTGMIRGRKVYLGEVRTDEAGRLIFLGGHGRADSFDGSIATDFANSDGWYDDTSDGPVTAAVLVNGRSIPCDPAWVVTAPPNYAPELKSVRTLFDLLTQVAVDNLAIVQPPSRRHVSFAREVYPIFRRMAELAWVNRGFAVQFGWSGPCDFLSADWVRRLSTPPADMQDCRHDEFREFRRQIFNSFRRPESKHFKRADSDNSSPLPWPWIYGDAIEVPYGSSPRQNTALTDQQMRVLEHWADGRFIDDFDPSAEPKRALSEVPLAEQPAALDEASLSFCLADAFHPGCEVTWPIRNWSMFMAPYRIRHRAPDVEEPDYGDVLTPAVALGAGGPLQGQAPGGLTRWMAVPWHTDTASCRSGYDTRYDYLAPTFWPARVPNDVLTQADYAIVMDTSKPIGERVSAFRRRRRWLRDLDMKASALHQINKMVRVFGQIGVVERRPGPGDAGFPSSIFVETKGADPVQDGLAAQEMGDVAPEEETVIFRHHVRGGTGA